MSFYKNTHTQEIRHFNVAGGKVIATIDINGQWVSNPTIADFENAGWEEYTPPTPEPYTPTYKERVVQLVRERYDTNDEISLLRQRDENPAEFAEYNAYVEACKTQAREETEDL